MLAAKARGKEGIQAMAEEMAEEELAELMKADHVLIEQEVRRVHCCVDECHFIFQRQSKWRNHRCFILIAIT